MSENVSRVMQQAMLSDGPPPGASVLDLYYEVKCCQFPLPPFLPSLLSFLIAFMLEGVKGVFKEYKTTTESEEKRVGKGHQAEQDTC